MKNPQDRKANRKTKRSELVGVTGFINLKVINDISCTFIPQLGNNP
jgi:hypothetical protein